MFITGEHIALLKKKDDELTFVWSGVMQGLGHLVFKDIPRRKKVDPFEQRKLQRPFMEYRQLVAFDKILQTADKAVFVSQFANRPANI